MLEPVLERTAEKLIASQAIDPATVQRLLERLVSNRLRTVAELRGALAAEAADAEAQGQ